MAYEILALLGIPVAALIAILHFQHPDGTVTDSQTGQTYERDEHGDLVLVSHHHRAGGHEVYAETIEAGVCPTCNSAITPDNHFCPGCGKKIK